MSTPLVFDVTVVSRPGSFLGFVTTDASNRRPVKTDWKWSLNAERYVINFCWMVPQMCLISQMVDGWKEVGVHNVKFPPDPPFTRLFIRPRRRSR